MQTRPDIPLDIPLGFLLADVQRLLRRRFERAAEAEGLGLSASEARTLAYITVYSGRRQTALADVMNVDPMTLVGYLDALEAKGLVERCPDPSDRRAKLVRPSSTAAAMIERVRTVGRTARETAMRGLSDDDVAALRRMLRQMIDNLSETDAAG
jgi:MarR family transcriptional regulator for hemolysin